MSKPEPPKDLLDWLAISGAPNWRVARPLGPLVSLSLALLLLGAIAAAFVVLWRTIADGLGTGAGSLGAGALIVALLGAPFLVWNTVIRQRTVEFAKETHITERISSAVEQLGAEKTVKKGEDEETRPNIEVRIGGLLLLERIAQDSTAYDRGRDHVRVMEILCAYVRENAPASEARDFPLPDWESLPKGASAEERAEHQMWRAARFGRLDSASNARQWASSLPPPRADIAIALRIIGRRTAEQRRIEACWGAGAAPDAEWPFDKPPPALPDLPEGERHSREARAAQSDAFNVWEKKLNDYRGYRLDLRETWLQNADLSGLVLSGADLSEARMEGARLSQAQMEGAALSRARMEGAILSRARMEGARLFQARMEGAILSRARLEGARLSQARMEGARLSKARMEGTILFRARLEGAILSQARMEGAHPSEARMEGAILTEARMAGANLSKARMEGAFLPRGRMEGAFLSRARMDETTSLIRADISQAGIRDVDLSAKGVTQAQIDSAFGDASVILPEGIDRPAHWPDRKLPTHSDPGFHDEWHKWRADPAAYVPPPKPATKAHDD